VNLNDLSTLMRQHSDQIPAPAPPENRVAAVNRRVDAARRRRTAAALAAVVAIVVAVPFIDRVHGVRTGIPAATATAPATVNGFPAYAVGGHLVATQTAPLNKSISLTVTPTDLGLAFSNRCSVVDQNIDIEITVALGGRHEAMLGCTTSGGNYASVDSLTTDQLTPGVPTSVTFSATAYRAAAGVTGDQTERTPVALPSGTYSVGVWQKLPFERYPLPPRPRTLPALNVEQYDLGDPATVQTVHSDPTNPLAPRTISYTIATCAKDVTSCNPTAATSQTPGLLHVAINGVEVDTAEFWDYSGAGWSFNIEPDVNDSLRLHAGDRVTITITPQYVTGGWVFAVAPGPRR
jgi:hypothetical protein